MAKVHRIAGMRISRVELPLVEDPVADFWQPKDALPDLEPPEDRIRRMKRHIFSADAISLGHSASMMDVLDPYDRSDEDNFSARATVYILNMIVIVMALPVGLALLFFNILGGENVRTTAHVIALTGLGIALMQAGAGAAVTQLM